MPRLDMQCGRCDRVNLPDESAGERAGTLRILILALLCAAPFVLGFSPVTVLAPYLALIVYVPSLWVIRGLSRRYDVVLFALFNAAASNMLVTFWLPYAVRDALAVSKLGALIVSVPLWTIWSLGNGIFLLLYRFLPRRWLALTACLGVLLFNQWPSIFGANPYLALMHASGLSGGAYFVGTWPLELAALLISALLVDGLLERRVMSFIKAALLVLTLLVLDALSAWHLRSIPDTALNVALVQTGNVFSKKLSSATDIEGFAQEIAAGAEPPDLVVFPESVFSFNLADDPKAGRAAIDALKDASVQLHTAFLLSAVQKQTLQGSPTKVTSMLIAAGQVTGFADKASTIPFAEYTPGWAVSALQILGVEINSRAPATDYQAMQLKGITLIPLSCFESLSERLVEQRLAGRPGLLVNQSNLDSFGIAADAGYRSVLWQHMAYEQQWINQWQIPLVRAVRSGGSTAIDGTGQVDIRALEGSWGSELVNVQVRVRGVSWLDAPLRALRLALKGLICLMAFVCVVLALLSLRGRNHGR